MNVCIDNNNIIFEINNKKIALDPENLTDADFIFISHAHLDHVPSIDTVTPKICSQITKELVQYRKNTDMINSITFDNFDIDGIYAKQLDSGHIMGSTSLLLEFKNKKIFYTGDICDKHRFHLKAATIPKSDIMIIESTYGHPSYQLPNISEVIDLSNEWIRRFLDNNNSLILLGYPLGKAQILMKIVEEYQFPLIVHDSIDKINEICKKYGFKYKNFISYSVGNEIIKNEQFIAIFPLSNRSITSINKINSKFPIKTAAFSGWALDKNYKQKLGVDEVFPLSDHSDFKGLIKIVKESSPEEVYTTHGFEEELANEIKIRLGIDAQPLSEKKKSKILFFEKFNNYYYKT